MGDRAWGLGSRHDGAGNRGHKALLAKGLHSHAYSQHTRVLSYTCWPQTSVHLSAGQLPYLSNLVATLPTGSAWEVCRRCGGRGMGVIRGRAQRGQQSLKRASGDPGSGLSSDKR